MRPHLCAGAIVAAQSAAATAVPVLLRAFLLVLTPRSESAGISRACALIANAASAIRLSVLFMLSADDPKVPRRSRRVRRGRRPCWDRGRSWCSAPHASGDPYALFLAAGLAYRFARDSHTMLATAGSTCGRRSSAGRSGCMDNGCRGRSAILSNARCIRGRCHRPRLKRPVLAHGNQPIPQCVANEGGFRHLLLPPSRRQAPS